MAESVDALVSNTSGATRAGSTPALGTIKYKVLQKQSAVSQKLMALFLFQKEALGCQRVANYNRVANYYHLLVSSFTFFYSCISLNKKKRCKCITTPTPQTKR